MPTARNARVRGTATVLFARAQERTRREDLYLKGGRATRARALDTLVANASTMQGSHQSSEELDRLILLKVFKGIARGKT
mmetsp:Transcript_27259/g.106475  ORF Transcript_27259/g.106475 Transcript_27259/m.106475 type:complete len:80 (-) Transcript_27259:1184-1423(-)